MDSTGIPETGKHPPSMSKLHHALHHVCFIRLCFPFHFIWVESSKERTQLNLKTRNGLTRMLSDCCHTQMRRARRANLTRAKAKARRLTSACRKVFVGAVEDKHGALQV